MNWAPLRLCASAVLIPASKLAFSGSFDPEPGADVEAAWSDQIRRRVAELDAGAVKTIPWEEARKELFTNVIDSRSGENV